MKESQYKIARGYDIIRESKIELDNKPHKNGIVRYNDLNKYFFSVKESVIDKYTNLSLDPDCLIKCVKVVDLEQDKLKFYLIDATTGLNISTNNVLISINGEHVNYERSDNKYTIQDFNIYNQNFDLKIEIEGEYNDKEYKVYIESTNYKNLMYRTIGLSEDNETDTIYMHWNDNRDAQNITTDIDTHVYIYGEDGNILKKENDTEAHVYYQNKEFENDYIKVSLDLDDTSGFDDIVGVFTDENRYYNISLSEQTKLVVEPNGFNYVSIKDNADNEIYNFGEKTSSDGGSINIEHKYENGSIYVQDFPTENYYLLQLRNNAGELITIDGNTINDKVIYKKYKGETISILYKNDVGKNYTILYNLHIFSPTTNANKLHEFGVTVKYQNQNGDVRSFTPSIYSENDESYRYWNGFYIKGDTITQIDKYGNRGYDTSLPSFE